jgi:serine/threonine protein phosphatase PrpC
MAGWGLDYETAEISLIGDRAQNQDRVAIARRDQSVILLVVDGMGGHAEGELAAQVAMDSLLRSFAEISNELENPAQYLTDSVERAHDEVASLGAELSLQDKPRATCAVCLVVGSTAWWSHVGDSRVYLLRDGQIVDRTRDHSHVEVLLREGVITEDEVHGHPMRHYVECCLGGESALPDLSSPDSFELESGDVLLACSDGLWSGVPDEQIGQGSGNEALDAWLHRLSENAVAACAPHSDNTTAAVVRVVDQ